MENESLSESHVNYAEFENILFLKLILRKNIMLNNTKFIHNLFLNINFFKIIPVFYTNKSFKAYVLLNDQDSLNQILKLNETENEFGTWNFQLPIKTKIFDFYKDDLFSNLFFEQKNLNIKEKWNKNQEMINDIDNFVLNLYSNFKSELIFKSPNDFFRINKKNQINKIFINLIIRISGFESDLNINELYNLFIIFGKIKKVVLFNNIHEALINYQFTNNFFDFLQLSKIKVKNKFLKIEITKIKENNLNILINKYNNFVLFKNYENKIFVNILKSKKIKNKIKLWIKNFEINIVKLFFIINEKVKILYAKKTKNLNYYCFYFETNEDVLKVLYMFNNYIFDKRVLRFDL